MKKVGELMSEEFVVSLAAKEYGEEVKSKEAVGNRVKTAVRIRIEHDMDMS